MFPHLDVHTQENLLTPSATKGIPGPHDSSVIHVWRQQKLQPVYSETPHTLGSGVPLVYAQMLMTSDGEPQWAVSVVVKRLTFLFRGLG